MLGDYPLDLFMHGQTLLLMGFEIFIPGRQQTSYVFNLTAPVGTKA